MVLILGNPIDFLGFQPEPRVGERYGGGGGLDKTLGGGTGCRRRRWRRAWQWMASIWAMGLVGVLRKNSVYCGLFSTV